MTDTYTKIVLTVIAGCLLVIAIRGNHGIMPANAQAGQTHVILDEVSQFAFQYATVPVRVRQ